MESREDALREALTKNEEETERWKQFKSEQETAVNNLNLFIKNLSVNVLVPIGSKAYIPGQLIHTNEVLVGHYQNYFSKCSAEKAKEICSYRIRIADDYVQKYKTEEELWQNKLNTPYKEGVIPTGEEKEIIEEFDEVKEKLWKEQHKIHVKKSKLKEKIERDKLMVQSEKMPKTEKEHSDEELIKTLEEAEILEDLQKELDNLEIDEVTDETVRKLMSGELNVSEKKRRAHQSKYDHVGDKKDPITLPGIVKKCDVNNESTNSFNTNNNIRPNPDWIQDSLNDEENYNAYYNDETELPPEVILIREQAKFLSPTQQIEFYELQLEIVRQKICKHRIKTEDDMDMKIHLHNVLEHLEDLLGYAEILIGNEELEAMKSYDEDYNHCQDNKSINEISDNNKAEEKSILALENEQIMKKNNKKRLSFALEDQTLEFRKNETVAEMLPSKLPTKSQHDVITLDEPILETTSVEKITLPSDKKKLILEKVEKNLEYFAEQQIPNDFDLVNRIIDSSLDSSFTVDIGFKHSSKLGYERRNAPNVDSDEYIPTSPADFYDDYLKRKERLEHKETPKIVYVNSYDGEAEVKVPILKENDRDSAYEDPRIKFSLPNGFKNDEPLRDKTNNLKSILCNKLAVKNEVHSIDNTNNSNNISKKKQNKKKKTNNEIDENEYMSAYYKVMSDVVEKPLTEPEELPVGNYIDAHAPKKRISRFKQMRSAGDSTTITEKS